MHKFIHMQLFILTSVAKWNKMASSSCHDKLVIDNSVTLPEIDESQTLFLEFCTVSQLCCAGLIRPVLSISLLAPEEKVWTTKTQFILCCSAVSKYNILKGKNVTVNVDSLQFHTRKPDQETNQVRRGRNRGMGQGDTRAVVTESLGCLPDPVSFGPAMQRTCDSCWAVRTASRNTLFTPLFSSAPMQNSTAIEGRHTPAFQTSLLIWEGRERERERTWR